MTSPPVRVSTTALSDYLGHRKYLIFVGSVLTGVAYALVLYLPMPELVERMLLFTAGFFGGFQMLTFAMAKEGHANRLVGTVIAFVQMIGIAGALIFQLLVGYLADLAGDSLSLALATVPICAGAAALITCSSRNTDIRITAQAPDQPLKQREVRKLWNPYCLSILSQLVLLNKI